MYKVERVYVLNDLLRKSRAETFSNVKSWTQGKFVGSKVKYIFRQRAKFQLTRVEVLSVKNEPFVKCHDFVNLQAERPSSSQENELPMRKDSTCKLTDSSVRG